MYVWYIRILMVLRSVSSRLALYSNEFESSLPEALTLLTAMQYEPLLMHHCWQSLIVRHAGVTDWCRCVVPSFRHLDLDSLGMYGSIPDGISAMSRLT